MGQAASLTVPDKLIMRVVHDEIYRPLDGCDIDTPRGESAKQEVRRLRGLMEQRVLGEEAEAELKEEFDKYDKDGSGEIDEHELGSLIKTIGLRRSKAEIANMVASVDDDGSGEICWSEFCKLLNVEPAGPKIVEDIEIGWDEPYGTIMYTEGDPDNDEEGGRFFYKEGDIDDLIVQAAERLAEERKWLSAEQKATFQIAFDRFDNDGSGTIDIQELGVLVKELNLMCSVDELVAGSNLGLEEYTFRDFCKMLVHILKEHSDGDTSDILSTIDGSKQQEIEQAEARKRDSGALVMWA